MFDPKRLLFIHGLAGSSQGYKATLLRQLYPQMLAPDFEGTLEQRMAQLEKVIGEQEGWTMVGSSLGGLMAALLAAQRPQQVRRLVLLAPALIWPEIAGLPPNAVPTPTVLYQGRRDELLPLEAVRSVAERVFARLKFVEVEDDHSLHATVERIPWAQVLEGEWEAISPQAPLSN